MQQSILVIDISVSPSTVQVVEHDGKALHVVESAEIPQEIFLPESIQSESPSQEVPAAQGTEASSPSQTEASPVRHPQKEILKNTLASFKKPFTNSVVILPANQCQSLNLELPFKNPKSVEKIIDLEVQDKVPFEIGEFFVEHRVLDALPTGGYRVHTSLAPRKLLDSVLSVCRSAELEPLIITTPASLAAGLGLAAGNIIYALVRQQYACLVVDADGLLLADRVIELPADPSQAVSKLLNQIQIFSASTERSIQKKIDRIFVIDETANELPPLPKVIGDKPLDVTWMAADTGSRKSSTMGALFALDESPITPLVNFRAREYSYSPRLGELIRGMRKLLPYALFVFLCLASFVSAMAYWREVSIRNTESRMNEAIGKFLPELPLEKGKEVALISKANFDLDTQLKDLGSPSRLNPLDILLELSKTFPKSTKVQSKTLEIRGNQVKIEGTAEDYGSITAVETALKMRKDLWCRVEKEIGSSPVGRAGGRGFTFELRMCD